MVEDALITSHTLLLLNVLLNVAIGGIAIPSVWALIKRLNSIRDHMATQNGRVGILEEWRKIHEKEYTDRNDRAETRHNRQHNVNGEFFARLHELALRMAACVWCQQARPPVPLPAPREGSDEPL
jgi:hypothetical protein